MSQATMLAGGMAVGFAGQIADSCEPDIVSGFNEATTQIPFGYGLRQGAAERQYVLPTGFSTTFELVGLAVHSYDHAPAGTADPAGAFTGDLGGSGLLQYASMDVARKGRFWVPVEQAVRIQDRAWVRGIATGTLTPGIWNGTNLGGSYHVDATRQAVFRTASFTSADGVTLIAVVEVDFTNRAA